MNDTFTVYSAMQIGEPFAEYKKTVVSKVCVTLLDPFKKQPVEKILEGEIGAKTGVVQVWSLEEDMFFQRMNERHFSDGTIIAFKSEKKKVDDKPIEQASDEEVREIVRKPFMTLKHILDKTTSEAFVNRILQMAIEEEKSEKVLSNIRTRLAEIQNQGLVPSE